MEKLFLRRNEPEEEQERMRNAGKNVWIERVRPRKKISRGPGKRVMPELVTTIRLDHESVVGIILLAGMDEFPDLEQTVLTPHELILGRALRNSKRRREWLGARVALKILLLREGLIPEPRGCEVRKDDHGRPYLHFFLDLEPVKSVDCSLSHKDEYALAAFTASPGIRLGADLEKISPRLTRLRSRFINKGDCLLAPAAEEACSAALWALKEAASKVSGVGLKTGLSSFVCQEKADKICRIILPRGSPLEATYFFLEDHVAAIAWMVGGQKES